MEERKKSSSSESELSDGWTVVDSQGDTVTVLTAPLEDSGPPLPSAEESSVFDEASDAESVEVILEDAADVFKYLPSVYMNWISPCNGGTPSEVENDGTTSLVIQQQYYSLLARHLMKPVYKEWLQVILIYTGLGVLMLLLLFFILFFQDQIFSKNYQDHFLKPYDDGVNQESAKELTLLAELTHHQAENKKLKDELVNLNEAFQELKQHQLTKDNVNVLYKRSSEHGLDVITDSGNVFNLPHLKLLHRQTAYLIDFTNYQSNIKNLMFFFGNVTSDTSNVTSTLSSLNNIYKHLDSLNFLSNNFHSEDKKSSHKDNITLHKIQFKLSNFLNRVEQDFNKIVDKMSNRVSKIHIDFLNKLCLIIDGKEVLNNTDCTNFKGKSKENGENEGYRHIAKKYDLKKEFKNNYKQSSENQNEIDKSNESFQNVKYSRKIELKKRETKDFLDSLKGSNFKARKRFDRPESLHSSQKVEHKEHSHKQNENISGKKASNKDYSNLSKDIADKKEKSETKITEEKKIKGKGNKQTNSLCKGIESSDCIKKRKNDIEHFVKQKLNKHPYSTTIENGKLNKNFIRNTSLHGKYGLKKNTNGADGSWFLEIGELRSRKRFGHHQSDWMFDRHKARNAHRDSAKWNFDRAAMREFCRLNSHSSWCTSKKLNKKDHIFQ